MPCIAFTVASEVEVTVPALKEKTQGHTAHDSWASQDWHSVCQAPELCPHLVSPTRVPCGFAEEHIVSTHPLSTPRSPLQGKVSLGLDINQPSPGGHRAGPVPWEDGSSAQGSIWAPFPFRLDFQQCPLLPVEVTVPSLKSPRRPDTTFLCKL